MAKGGKKNKKKDKGAKTKEPPETLPPELMSHAQLSAHLTSLVQELEREKAMKEESQIETAHYSRSVAFLKPQVEEARSELEHKKCILHKIENHLYSILQVVVTRSRYLMKSKLEASNVINIENSIEVYLTESAPLPSQKLKLRISELRTMLDNFLDIYKKTLKNEMLLFDSVKNSMDYELINFIDFFSALQEKKIQIFGEALSVSKRKAIDNIKNQQRADEAIRVAKFHENELTNHNYYKTILHRSNSIISYYVDILAKIKVSTELLSKKFQEAKQTQKEMIVNQQTAEIEILECREKLPKDKSYLKETRKIKQKQREIKIDVASLEGEVQMKKLLIYNNEAKCLEFWDDFTDKFEESKQVGALDTLLILKKNEYLNKKLEKVEIKNSLNKNILDLEEILKEKDKVIDNLRSQVKYVCYCKKLLQRIYQKKLNRGLNQAIN